MIHTKVTLLIVEDDAGMRYSLEVFFSRKGYQVFTAETCREGMDLYRKNQFDLVVLDKNLRDGDGLDLLRRMKEVYDDSTLFLITGHPDVETARSALKAGACKTLRKPFELNTLDIVVNRALEFRRLQSEVLRLRHQAQRFTRTPGILGTSPAIQQVRDLIARVAQPSHTPVLIQGESWTGKDMVADAIHQASDRAKQSLVKIHCGALPENLLESELFGYEKGAFTEARQSQPGLLELADGGSLFLDEIGAPGPALQSRLLRVIEGRPFRKPGGRREVKADVRILAATHRNLYSLVDEGAFRKDLYHRLNVLVIDVPPLRERREDVLRLAERFRQEIGEELRKEVWGFSEETRKWFLSYSWPGNLRELRNVIERALILTRSEVIQEEDLPIELRDSLRPDGSEDPFLQTQADLSLETLERAHIRIVLDHFHGNKAQAARALGIARSTVEEKIRKYGWKETVR